MWYDPPDLTTLFQDSAGTIPVTAFEQPVGRILDKSGRGNHATQATAAKRPTYSARYNLLLATETLATQNVTTVATAYTLAFSGAGSITLSGTKTGTYTAGTNTLTGVTAGTLTLTVSGSVTKADLRLANDGVGLPAYQRVTTATDYDTVGFPAYLKFDGVDDYLSVSSFPLPLRQRMTAVAFAENAAVANQGLASVCPATGDDWNSMSGYVMSPNNRTTTRLGVKASASDYRLYWDNSPAALIPRSIITEQKGLGAGTLRVNGVVVATDTSFSEPATVSDGMLLLGARFLSGEVNTSAYLLNGRIYSLIVRGAQTSDAQIAQVETYLNQRAKVY